MQVSIAALIRWTKLSVHLLPAIALRPTCVENQVKLSTQDVTRLDFKHIEEHSISLYFCGLQQRENETSRDLGYSNNRIYRLISMNKHGD